MLQPLGVDGPDLVDVEVQLRGLGGDPLGVLTNENTVLRVSTNESSVFTLGISVSLAWEQRTMVPVQVHSGGQ